jgi:hypothetical protein
MLFVLSFRRLVVSEFTLLAAAKRFGVAGSLTKGTNAGPRSAA